MRYITLGDSFDFKFTTRRFTTGAPHTLASSPVISAYLDNNTTEVTAGITLTADFDSRTGLNNVRVVASGGNGYSAGTWVFVITTGTVDSVSVVGEVVYEVVIGTVPANVTAVGGTSQTAGDIMGALNRNVVFGTVTTGGSTTSVPTSSLSPAAGVTDQFKGRVILFDRATTTANLRGQGAPIDGSTSGGTITIAAGNALTTAPASGDTFTIV
jgi:hypothetical protein